MNEPSSYKFVLLSKRSNFNGDFDTFGKEVERHRQDIKERIAAGKVTVNEFVRINPVEIRSLSPDVSCFQAVFEVDNEYSYKIVTIDDAHVIRDEVLKNPIWIVTKKGSPIEIGR